MSGFRLRPLVEVVETDDGGVYLLRGPAGGDCAIRRAPAATMALLDALRKGGSIDELQRAVRGSGHRLGACEVRSMVDDLDRAGVIEAATPYDDEARMARQLLYLRDRVPPGLDATAAHDRIRAAHAVVLGCGGLGSWAAAGLACMGIGRLTLVDDDAVELSNLNRQLLFRERDVGRSKVEAATETLRAFNSELRVDALDREIRDVDDVRELVRGTSIVFCLADRPPYELARRVNLACLAENVPHMSAGQLPPIVRVGPLVVPGQTSCTGCLELQLRDQNPLYDRLEALRSTDARPLAALGPASAVVGGLLAMEALHLLSGIARPATWGAAWSLDLRTFESAMVPVGRRGDCTACG